MVFWSEGKSAHSRQVEQSPIPQLALPQRLPLLDLNRHVVGDADNRFATRNRPANQGATGGGG